MTNLPAVPSLTVEDVPIDRLHPDPANPRRIGDDELEALTRSLREFGVVQPVLARRDDGIAAGIVDEHLEVLVSDPGVPLVAIEAPTTTTDPPRHHESIVRVSAGLPAPREAAQLRAVRR